jgi:hypothetical protein
MKVTAEEADSNLITIQEGEEETTTISRDLRAQILTQTTETHIIKKITIKEVAEARKGSTTKYFTKYLKDFN